MSAVLTIVDPGFLSTVQDEGRRGHQHIGVPVSGALDRIAFRLANALVGNGPNAAGIEMVGIGPTFEVTAPAVRVALMGSGSIDVTRPDHGTPSKVVRTPPGQSVRAVKGEILKVRLAAPAVYSYLAIEGGLDVPLCLGSRSTYVRGGFGGLAGRKLMVGDVLHGFVENAPERPEQALSQPRGLDQDQPIRVVMGPQDDLFTDAAIATFLTASYQVTPASDRMGLRLSGPPLVHKHGFDLVSDGITAGCIQVPGSQQPIILMADAQTAGGYPKIATVIAADLPRIAQRGVGQPLRFVAVSRDEATALRGEQERDLQSIIDRFCEVAATAQVDLDALHEANLISGVIDGRRYDDAAAYRHRA